MMKIAVGSDHGGYPLKQVVVNELTRLGHEVIDCGAHEVDVGDDYPDFARAVGLAVQRGETERGVMLCGSGVGACVAVNKVRGARACVCHDTYSAAQGVEHDAMNVLCLGSRIIGEELARALVRAFAAAQVSTDPRFHRRLDKVLRIERDQVQ
jgi:ribose 5-phosphate isomerase B